MDLQQDSSGYWYVGDVVADQQVRAPLGRLARTVGPHAVGFDDTFTGRVTVRAYYDPAQDPGYAERHARSAFDLVGYVQYCALTFNGQPITPGVLGGRLADRDVYTTKDKYFLDFMGPADAVQRGILPELVPYYAYNSALTDGTLTTFEDFVQHPLANGSLYRPGPPEANMSRVASLCAEVTPDLITRTALIDLLTNRDPFALIIQPLTGREPYRVALDVLAAEPVPPQTVPFLQGLEIGTVIARVVGEFVLLTLPDIEHFGPTLCIRSTAQGVEVYLLSDNDMAVLETGETAEALYRIHAAVDAMAIDSTGHAPDGLYTSPFPAGDELEVNLRYYTVAVGHRAHSSTHRRQDEVLSGFTWEVRLRYDEDTNTLPLVAVEEPRPLASDQDLFAGIFNRFTTVMRNTDLRRSSIDVSNFTMAALHRDGFAVVNRPTYVTPGGGSA
jgi:hypothetical protein